MFYTHTELMFYLSNDLFCNRNQIPFQHEVEQEARKETKIK